MAISNAIPVAAVAPAQPPLTSESKPYRAPLWLLAMLTLSGTTAIHIFVPAMPALLQEFDTSKAMVQLTLSAYVIGLALAQLVYGPIADRVGRRPVLVAGMVIFAVASAAAWFASSIEVLIAARFFEAIGGGSGMVLGRAMVRDGCTMEEAAKKQSLLTMMVMVGPGLSPLLGMVLADATGWRSIFLVLCGLGLLNLMLIWRLLPAQPASARHSWHQVIRNYIGLLKSPTFLAYTIGGGFGTMSIYAYVGAAPFIIVHQLQRPANEVAWYLGLNILGVWFGSLLVNRLVGKLSRQRILLGGNLLSCASALVMLAAVLSDALSISLLVGSMALLAMGAGMCGAMAVSESLNVNPEASGSAAGLYGFCQMMTGALCSAISGFGDHPALATALVLTASGAIAQFSFWIGRRSAG